MRRGLQTSRKKLCCFGALDSVLLVLYVYPSLVQFWHAPFVDKQSRSCRFNRTGLICFHVAVVVFSPPSLIFIAFVAPPKKGPA